MRSAIRDGAELCRSLGLPSGLFADAAGAAQSFSVFVPRPFLSRILPGDPADPLLLQVIPAAAEGRVAEGFVADPVGDLAASWAPGALKKYEGRVLLVVTGACAVHCRYCFRRHFDYEEAPHGDAAWQPALEALAADRSIREVILSGGDPLTVADQSLATLVEQIAEVQHVARLRIHTRLPIMIPARVNDELLRWLTGTRLTSVMVIHANHARELDQSVAEAIQSLAGSGVMLLNQAVLLRGVNDSVDALTALSERLIEIGVTPYYLHQLDRVAGAAHFEVAESRGQELVGELRRRLPGYMVPRYVREVAGAEFKTPL
jgi:EF-P beta-lysylation protein EpmB